MSASTDLTYDISTKTLQNVSTEPITIRTIQKSDPNVDFNAVGANWVVDPGSELALNPVRIGPGASVLTVVWLGAALCVRMG